MNQMKVARIVARNYKNNPKMRHFSVLTFMFYGRTDAYEAILVH